MPSQQDGKTQSQVVADELAKALTESEVGQRLATAGAPDGGTLLEIDPAAVWEVLRYFSSELLALKRIVRSLAAAADRLDRP